MKNISKAASPMRAEHEPDFQFDQFWSDQSRKGDPSRNSHLVRESFNAGRAVGRLEIYEHLDKQRTDVISRIQAWQSDAGRPLAVDTLQISKHVGYQLEEMAELLDALNMRADPDILDLQSRIETMSKLFKTGVKIAQDPNRKEVVDASCDLTVFGVAQMMVCGYEPVAALDEVQRSNDSKRFPDGSLRKDEHGKIVKAATYFKPNLDVALVP